MTFTDDDLVWFKHKYGHLAHCDALLARLEAAENVVGIGRLHECLSADCWTCEALEAWRKAAGK
jgi:hypothetical protein